MFDLKCTLSLRDECLKLRHSARHHVIVHVWDGFPVHLVCELNLEVLKERRHRQLAHYLDERFPYADPAAAEERRKAVGVPSRALWRQKEATFVVESLWDESFRLNPLFGVVAQVVHHDGDDVAFPNFELFALHVLRHAHGA